MEELRKAWQEMPADMASPAALRNMIHRHPARMRMRRQMVIEIVLFIVFLLVYYDFFDGARRPWSVNALLVAAVGLVIVQNMAGYIFSRKSLNGEHLQEMLRRHVSGMRWFAVTSVITRAGMVVCLLLFFCSGIVWDDRRIWIVGGIVVIAVFQMAWLGWMWRNRIRDVSRALEA